ncbi:MAG: trypsin-like peptidase domain-containing protein [Sedimentisphaerales bacterium]|nr:trypsin-like peptidase domain-containing protein [Sedimentisphaerales bacterium]
MNKRKWYMPLGVVLLVLLPAAVNPAIAEVKPLTPEERNLVAQINNVFRRAVEQVGPAVVSIQVSKESSDDPYRPGSNIGLGSGCIVDGRGYVVTNNHVVEDTDKIEVILAGGRRFVAQEKYVDPDTDLAVVKIDPAGEPLPVARWGDSEQLHVGDMVLAVGNPFGLEQTITSGIVSYVGRQTGILGKWGYEDFIQTDAAINKGNSGGPLVNLYGEVVGINSNILTPTGTSAGYGFAVPSRISRYVAEQLIQNQQVVRGWLGVQMIGLKDAREIPADQLSRVLEASIRESFEAVPAEVQGVLVTQVLDNSPARAAGLESGDVITRLNGRPITESKELRDQIASLPPGGEARLDIWRREKTEQVVVTLGDRSIAQELEEQRNTRIANRVVTPDLPGLEDLPLLPAIPEKPDKPLKLGVVVRALTEQTAPLYGYESEIRGVVIAHVYPDSVAEHSGLRQGDVILQVDDHKVETTQDLKAVIAGADLNQGVRMQILNEEGTKIRIVKQGAD